MIAGVKVENICKKIFLLFMGAVRFVAEGCKPF